MTHPLPKARRATSLKEAFLPSSPGRVPTCRAHRDSSQRPKAAVVADVKHETIPGIRPILANAAGKASAPEPTIVFAKFENEESTLAPGAGRALRVRRRIRGSSIDGDEESGGEMDVAP